MPMQISSTLLGLMLFVFAPACSSLRSNFDARTQDDLENLKSTLKADSFLTCKSFAPGAKLTVPVQNARIFWNDSAPVLVYEGIFRDAMKTVWQPLTPQFKLNGEGVVIGQKSMSYVGNFTTNSDASGGFWTTYRFKIPGTEMHATAVEFLQDSSSKKIVRLAMPQLQNHTAQRSWIIPLPQPGTDPNLQKQQRGLAHIVVRTVSTQPGSIEGSTTTYTWYLLHAPKGIVKKMGEHKVGGTHISIEKFVLSREHSDPVGIGITSSKITQNGGFHESKNGVTTVLAIRPFSSGSPTHVIHEDERPLSSLTVSEKTLFIDSVSLAWVRDPLNSTHPSIEWISSPIKVPGTQGAIPLKPNQNKRLTRNTSLKRISLGYFPSQLEFTQVGAHENTPQMALSWWGGEDTERGLILLPLNSTPPKELAPSLGRNPNTRAVVSAENLGWPLSATFSATHEKALIITHSSNAPSGNSTTPAEIRFCAVTKEELSK